MKIERYGHFLTEKKDTDDLKSKLSSDYKSMKVEIINMIESTIGTDKNAIDIEDFINDYISSGKESSSLNQFIEDNDIFNFYISYQGDIDKFLNSNGYLKESPKSHNVFSLYDVVIDGTKQCVLEMIELIQTELFKDVKL